VYFTEVELAYATGGQGTTHPGRYGRFPEMTISAMESGSYDSGADRETQVRRENPRRSGRWTLGILVLGLVTYFPALTSPLILDDYLHAAMVRGAFPSPRSPFALYDFVSDADRQLLLARGVLPWWTHPHLTIRFLRPLSSALLWADYSLFRGRPLLLHAQSFLWWGLAIFAARALYRRHLSLRVTLLATAIFALGPWHAIPLAWLANSEALVSLGLGTLALVAYVRWREAGSAASGILATLLFGLALLGGEYALCFGGYCVAFELGCRDGTRRRVLGLLPFALPAVGYLVARSQLGYGVVGSGFYSDPLRDPEAFLALAPWRVVALLLDGWLALGAEFWNPGAARWAGALIVAAGFAIVIGPLRRAVSLLDAPARETATWLLKGSLFAMLPVLAVVPSARLLGVSALGIAGGVAVLLDRAWFGDAPAQGQGRDRAPRERSWAFELTGLAAIMLGFAHLVHGPVTAWLTGSRMRDQALDFVSQTAWLRQRVTDVPNTEVVVMRAGEGVFFGAFAVDPEGPLPAEWRTLSHTGHALVLRRDLRTLDLVAPPDKGVFPTGPGNLFRSPDAPLAPGDEVSVPGMRARILEAGTNGPVRVRFSFDRDLSSPSLVLTSEDAYGFKQVDLPKVGFGAPFDP